MDAPLPVRYNHSNFQLAPVLLRAVCATEQHIPMALAGRSRLERRPLRDRRGCLHGIRRVQGIKKTVREISPES